MKDWEKTCREKTGLGFETFKTIAHCDAETLDALLEAASVSIKGTMYFDWLMEYLSLAQSGKNADAKTVVDDIDARIIPRANLPKRAHELLTHSRISSRLENEFRRKSL